MDVLDLPRAQDQGHATFLEALRGESVILGGCLFIGILGYTAALVILGFVAAFARPLPFRAMNRAAMCVGVGCAALIQLYSIPLLIFGVSDRHAIAGICLAFLGLILAIVAATGIVLREIKSRELPRT